MTSPSKVIPAEAIEAAAKYLHDNDCRSAVHSGFPADFDCYDWMEEARELLEAAAPHILAGAWEEGYMFSYDQERGGNGELPIPVPEYLADDLVQWNPHRPTP